MTPQEFAERMRKIKEDEGGDIEADHANADALMCQALNELGYGEGISIYELMDKWYA